MSFAYFGGFFETSMIQLPEPLQPFEAMASSLADVLAETDRAADRLRQARMAGKILPNTFESLRVEITYNSNALEGNTLTLRETQLIIEGKTPAGEKPLREIYEARNHDRALRLIEKWAKERPSQAVSHHDLLEVHAQVLADIDYQTAGAFRSERVRIVGTGFIPPAAQKFDVLIPALLEMAAASDVHPVLQAAELHYNLVAVHPFNDGNGRTARVLMNHHLLRHAYPYAIIEVNNRAGYLAALDEANHGRLEPFTRLVAQSILNTMPKLLL